MKSVYLFLIGISIPLAAQEARYKSTLDSIGKYIRYTKSEAGKPFKLLSYYHPGMFNGMSDETDSVTFYSMTHNEKTKVVFSDGNEIYMVDLKKMDSTMLSPARNGIRFYDPKGKVKFRKSYIARIFNGKHGGVETDYFILNMNVGEENKAHYEALMKFLKEALLYSKKVKTQKSELKFVE